MNRTHYYILTSIIGLTLSTSFVSAQTDPRASTTSQKALETVRERLEDLVGAKDTTNGDDELALRLDTFKKVVDFSLEEAKELKVKLVALSKGTSDEEKWKNNVLKKEQVIEDYYISFEEVLEEKEEKITLDELKKLATDFKEWRDLNAVPFLTHIRNFLAINQEQDAIQIAEKRAQKIAQDIAKLQKAKVKNLTSFTKSLQKAQGFIQEGKVINTAAYKIFTKEIEMFFPTTTSSPTSSESIVVPSESKGESKHLTTISPSTTTSTPSSSLVQAVSAEPSLRDLVRQSLEKVKQAYQVFIEMSNSVRELLN